MSITHNKRHKKQLCLIVAGLSCGPRGSREPIRKLQQQETPTLTDSQSVRRTTLGIFDVSFYDCIAYIHSWFVLCLRLVLALQHDLLCYQSCFVLIG